MESSEEHFCKFGCGQPAHYQNKKGEWRCSKYAAQCPVVRAKNADKQLKRVREGHYGLTRWNELRKQGLVPSWDKGLTAETDARVRARTQTLRRRYKTGELTPSFTGRHWSEEHRKRLSEIRKKYLSEHPDKIPYLLNHSSRISYPERYFRAIFRKEGIALDYHLQVGRYELDFYNLESKRYIEIDGESHYVDPKTVEIDIERTKYLHELGWEGRRIRWKTYKKLSLSDRRKEIAEIKSFIPSKH